MKYRLALALLVILAACAAPRAQPPIAATPTLTDEAATLGSLRLVNDYPLYVMDYIGSYQAAPADAALPDTAALPASVQGTRMAQWGCSLFAALGDETDRLYGRNFDWQFSPALLLFTDPPDGYASVSMVDMHYLGFDGERSKHLEDLSLEERRPLLDAPQLPFDGMNEKGIAVGMAAVPPQPMPHDPQHKTLGQLEVIREILDHAATVDEAVAILGSYNIDMSDVPIHYLIASASGESALVEFYQAEMVVFRNEAKWQTATNFLVSDTDGEPGGYCPRYDRMTRALEERQGRQTASEALRLLQSVSQDNTQWSIVYHMQSGDIEVVMDRGYSDSDRRFTWTGQWNNK